MQRPARLNLILLLLVLLLGTLYLLQPPSSPPPPAEARISALQPQAVMEIELRREGEPEIRLEKRAEGWWMTAPRLWPANPSRVLPLLAVLEQSPQGHFNSAGIALQEFGLQPPQAVLLLNKQPFAFGRSEPLNHWRYLQHQGELYLLDEQAFIAASVSLARLLSPRLLEQGGRIRRLQLPGLTLQRDKDGWHSSSPTLQGDALMALLDSWQLATALGVELSSEPPPKGAPRIQLLLEDGRQLDLALQQQEGDLLLRRLDSDLLYRFNPYQARQLLGPSFPILQ